MPPEPASGVDAGLRRVARGATSALQTVRLQRMLAVAAFAVLTVLTAGCHKQKQVSRQSPPPAPPPLTRRTPSPPVTARRMPLPLPLPREGDNLPSSGREHSVELGMASWYAPSGRRSANGEVYDGNSMTAAHRTLPMGTVLRVTNLTTGLAVTVTVTDRGPFVTGRVLDLSTSAAKATGVYRMGVAQVRMEVLQQGSSFARQGRWCVQIGAFKNEGNAADLKADLQRRYSGVARVIEFQGATGYWVRLNPLDGDRARAALLAQSLKPSEDVAEAWLVRLD